MCAWLSISSYGSIVRLFSPRGLSLQTFSREVRSLGFPTAHRRRGNCYRVVEV